MLLVFASSTLLLADKELPYFPPRGAIPEFNLQREAETNILLLIKNKWKMFMVRKENISLKYGFVFHSGTMKNTYLKCLRKDAGCAVCSPDSWGCRCWGIPCPHFLRWRFPAEPPVTQLSDILSRISRGARILARFVSTMQPFNSISSKMMCTLSKLNIMSNSLTRLK